MYSNWRIKKADLLNDELHEKLAEEEKAVADWCNDNQQYQINDDEEYIFVEPIPAPTEQELAEREIAELKQFLADTDYIANKLIEAIDDAELSDLKEKYADVLRRRREARARINELEK